MRNIFLTSFKKPFFVVSFAFLLALLLLLINQFSFWKELEYKTIDFRFRVNATPDIADTDILLVTIDDYSLQEFSNNGISWPWPRDFYQIALHYLQQSGAKMVLFDILFYEPDIDRAEFQPGYTDKLFADAIKNSGNVTLAIELTQNENLLPVSLDKFHFNSSFTENIQTYQSAILPIPVLLETVRALGVVNVKPDSDGIVRRVPYLYKFEDYYLPQLALAAILQENRLIEPAISFQNEHFVYWYAAGGANNPFPYIPFFALIQSFFAGQNNSEALLSSELFKDKIIIIGSTASGTIRDVISTPFPQVVPGIELWATIISNLRQSHTISFLPTVWSFFLLFGLIVSSYLIFCRFHRFREQLLFFLIPIIYALVVMFGWNYGNVCLPVISPFFAFLITFLFLILMSYFSEGKAKIEIQKIFSRYLHPDVISELIQHPDTVKLGGKEIKATILFTDIANFTTFSEGKNAPQLIQYLNEYFNHLTGFVLEYRGLLDKYTGDGIMAIFGAPLTSEDNALLACRAALAHKRFSDNLTGDEVIYHLHKNTRLGINTGLIVAGNLGSSLRMDYTAIGDDVNLAARLEGVNKIYKTRIMISDNTYQAVQDNLLCRELDTITVKGKHNTTTVYELLEERSPETIIKLSWLDDFNQAITMYKAGNWQNALEKFQKVHEFIPNDYATDLFIERCKKLLANPPQVWNFVLNLESK
jgi:adenylate cyclase